MKVFLSWSGSQSHKVALVFRDWLPSVIQEIVPYVSSEDIDKGARWSTDIAKELTDSTFGILCVTRDNINAPWLTFEAGALSKTIDKSFVSPFLFDIKRSEVDGPMLQFQSTIFEKDDLKKLVTTLNKACEKDGLTPDRLAKTFEVWYPTLENELNKHKNTETPKQEDNRETELQTPMTQEILEEILELSRINQKLLRNPGGSLGSNLEEINSLLRSLIERTEIYNDSTNSRRMRKVHPMILEEIMHTPIGDGYMGFQIALSLIRDQCPWIYDAGIEVINVMRSNIVSGEKKSAISQFRRVIDYTLENPMIREKFDSKEIRYFLHKLPDVLARDLKRSL